MVSKQKVWLRYCGTAGKPGGKLRRQNSTWSHGFGLRYGQPYLIAMQESAEGILSRRKRALTVAGRTHPGEGPNGAACRMAGVNESGY